MMPLPPWRTRPILVLLVWACFTPAATAQDVAHTPRPVEVSGAVNINSKGISLVPALTLGRPSAIFDLAVRKGDLSFEPQLRFALDGKPWSFLLWARYRAVTRGRFRLTVGGHPAFSFKTTTSEVDGRPREVIEVRRYLAGELTPIYMLTPRVGAGGYYLYSRGIDPGAAPHTHFVAARASLTNLGIFRSYVVHAAPQFYYLRTNGEDGAYLGATASFGRRGAPWSIATIVNQPVRTRVRGGRDFLWNVSVNYAFR